MPVTALLSWDKKPCLWVVKTLSLDTFVLSWAGILTTPSMLQGHRGVSWGTQRQPRCPQASIIPHKMAEQLGTRCNHCDELCQGLYFRGLMQSSTRRFSASLHKCTSSTESLVRFSQYRSSCSMFDVHLSLSLGLCLKPNRPGIPAAIPMSSPLSTKDEEQEELHPHCWVFIPPDSDEVVLQRETKPPGADESCCWVSQAPGLFAARAAILAQRAVTFASHLRGRSLWLDLYKSFSTVLHWPTVCSMDMEHTSSCCPKPGNLDCSVHHVDTQSLQSGIANTYPPVWLQCIFSIFRSIKSFVHLGCIAWHLFHESDF